MIWPKSRGLVKQVRATRFDDKSGQAKQVIVQVKDQNPGRHCHPEEPQATKDLRSSLVKCRDSSLALRMTINVIAREKAAMGVLITLREPTKPMLTEAASAGFYEPKEFPGRYPRLQILTIAELLSGKKIRFPEHRVVTFAKAERKTKSQQEGLF